MESDRAIPAFLHPHLDTACSFPNNDPRYHNADFLRYSWTRSILEREECQYVTYIHIRGQLYIIIDYLIIKSWMSMQIDIFRNVTIQIAGRRELLLLVKYYTFIYFYISSALYVYFCIFEFSINGQISAVC